MGCVSSHEEVSHGMTENDTNRFKVVTDDSLTTELSVGVRSGILEVNDDELIHYQKNGEPIHWPFRCLRRYGLGNDTFLFESGRRCSTGPGLFAFKCRRAQSLHNVFAEKLRRYSTSQNPDHTQRLNSTMSTLPIHNRYSEDMIRTQGGLVSPVEVEPYLIPLPGNQANPLVDTDTGYGTFSYVNCPAAPAENTSPSHNYMNTNNVPTTNGINGTNGIAVNGSVRATAENASGPPIREINYAELDLPKSDAIGFPQQPRQQNGKLKHHVLPDNIQYVDMPSSSDDDDDAFLPPTHDAALSYVNVVNGNNPAQNGHVNGVIKPAIANGGSDIRPRTDGRVNGTSTTSHTSYVNIEGAHSQSNGMIQVMYSDSGTRSSSVADYKPPELKRPPVTNGDNSSTQYTFIDFQKTAAIASTAKSTQPEPSEEGVRKTRHDSSADDLN